MERSGPEGEVEGERPTLDREGKRSGAARAEPLQHGEEGGQARRAEQLYNSPESITLVESHDELVLEEPARAVEQVPIGHAVKRMEERGDRVNLTFGSTRGLAVPGLVEDGHGERVQKTSRSRGRHT